ncbi:MAG: ATP-binding protein [Caulobacterales bacterium]
MTLKAEEAGRVVLIVAPIGRDARAVEALLQKQNHPTHILADLTALSGAINDMAGAIVITEEAFHKADLTLLNVALESQPEWSDVPFVILSSRGTGAGSRATTMLNALPPRLTNTMLLERPLSSVSLVSAVEWALRSRSRQFQMRDRMRELRKQAQALAILNKTGAAVAADVEVGVLVQRVVNAGVELTGAQFGAFFYNVENAKGESYMLHALAGDDVDMDSFSKFPMPRNTAVFAPTFSGERTVRSDNIRIEPEYGHNAPHAGLPKGHLPVVSYLAVPVRSRDGGVIGGLFFGHGETGKFAYETEALIEGLAGEAAIAMDNANLFQRSRKEIERRMAVEDELRTLNEELEQRVASEIATRLEAEEQLRQSQKMEAVGQLTGGIAHDFNNMLTGVIGALSIIKRRIAQNRYGDIDTLMDAATTSAQRAAALTHRLLAFSRRQSLDPRPVDLNALVMSMEDLMTRTIGEQSALEFQLDSELPAAKADSNQVESALLNLVINARDAMTDGGSIRIMTGVWRFDPESARAHEGLTPGDYVFLSVVDDGIGMSPETISRAFDPFFTTKPQGQGTGLGLSMIYGFAQQSGGLVQIRSKPNQGTTVTLYLPVANEAVSDAEAEETPFSAARSGEAVLVVEDDASVRLLVVEVLRELGYHALEAPDAKIAIPILQSDRRIDLLVSDVGLPGMNGRQLAEIAREHRSDLKVLFITGYAQNAEDRSGFLAPGMEMMSKPFAVDALSFKIRSMIEGAPAL